MLSVGKLVMNLYYKLYDKYIQNARITPNFPIAIQCTPCQDKLFKNIMTLGVRMRNFQLVRSVATGELKISRGALVSMPLDEDIPLPDSHRRAGYGVSRGYTRSHML